MADKGIGPSMEKPKKPIKPKKEDYKEKSFFVLIPGFESREDVISLEEILNHIPAHKNVKDIRIKLNWDWGDGTLEVGYFEIRPSREDQYPIDLEQYYKDLEEYSNFRNEERKQARIKKLERELEEAKKK